MSPRFHPLARLIIAAVSMFVAIIVVVIVMGAALQTAALASRRSATSFEAFLSNNALLVTTLLYPPALLALWACRRTLDRLPFRSLGLRTRGSFSSFASGAGAALFTLSILFAVLWLCGLTRVNGFSSEYSKAGERAFFMLTLHALAFLAVGFFEEVVFRGYAFHNLKAWLGLKAAIVTQAIVFAAIHIPNIYTDLTANGKAATAIELSQRWADARWGLINIALIGVFFALCYLKSGSLWFPIGFHAAWNFALGCLFSLPVSGIALFRVLDVTVVPSWLTGGTFGLEGSMLLAPLIVAMCWVVSRQPNHAQALTDLAALGGKQDASQVETSEEENGESHLAGIRASMRPSSPQPRLDLSGLNTMRPQPKTTPFLVSETTVVESSAPTSSTQTEAVEEVAVSAANEDVVAESALEPIKVVTPPVEVVAPLATTPVAETVEPEPIVDVEPRPVVIEPLVVEPQPKPKKPAPKW